MMAFWKLFRVKHCYLQQKFCYTECEKVFLKLKRSLYTEVANGHLTNIFG